MRWEVEYTDQFEQWWTSLCEGEQEAVARSVELLLRIGPSLARPHADSVKGLRLANLKELRTQYGGEPYRTLFAFDPRRCAILLVGGCKTGDARWYQKMIPLAEKLYSEHLAQLPKEGLIDG